MYIKPLKYLNLVLSYGTLYAFAATKPKSLNYNQQKGKQISKGKTINTIGSIFLNYRNYQVV